MKLWSFSILASCCVAGLIVFMTQEQPTKTETAPASQVLIRTDRLLDLQSGAYKSDQGVVIESGYIKEVGAFATIRNKSSKTVRIVNLGHAALLPGLIDCHSHLFSAMDCRDDTTKQMTEAERMKVGEKHAREYLDAGVTTVRDLGHGGGRDLLLRDRIGAGLIPGPDIFAAARRLTPSGGEGMTAASSPEVIRNIAEVSGGRENALRKTREVMQMGANVIKVVVNDGSRLLTVEELSAIVEEAHRAGLKVAAHATNAAAIRIAVEAGVDSVEHGNEVSEEMLGEMVKRGIFLVSNSFTEQSLRQIFAAEIRRHPADQPDFEAFIKDNQQQSLRRMQLAIQEKVKIAAGSDMVFIYPGKTRGQASIVNLEALRSQGLPALDVIRAMTINAAELLGVSGRVGSIEAGKHADIIAVDGDPLTDMTVLERVKFVMKKGLIVKNEISK
ncbi:MAG: amidohydrolase family protein [Acidobacteria bacterium]|nr:amidohydrolase family protein [Acidobacteriota bacterium]